MRRFVVNLALFAAVQAVIVGLVFVVSADGADQKYMAAAIDKHEAVARADGQHKVLLVGGSNLAFGVSAKDMTEQLDVPVVNLGLHVELGSRFQLNEARAVASPGDTIVLSLEYSVFSTRREANTSVLMELLAARPASRKFVDTAIVKQLTDEGLVLIGEQAKLAQDNVLRGSNVSKPPYNRASFNEFGDATGHHDLEPFRPLQVARVANTTAQVAVAIEEIRAFVDEMHTRGVTVAIDYPDLPDERFALHEESIARVHDGLAAVPNLVLLGEPGSLPDACFYDTEYHLVASCAEDRTARLVDALAGEPPTTVE